MKIDDKIRNLGRKFQNRLNKEIIDSALEYIDFNEPVLAFETLCDHIGDFHILITKEEYQEIFCIAQSLDLEIDERYFTINPKTF